MAGSVLPTRHKQCGVFTKLKLRSMWRYSESESCLAASPTGPGDRQSSGTRAVTQVVVVWCGVLVCCRSLRLDGNNFTGTVPSALSALTQLL